MPALGACSGCCTAWHVVPAASAPQITPLWSRLHPSLHLAAGGDVCVGWPVCDGGPRRVAALPLGRSLAPLHLCPHPLHVGWVGAPVASTAILAAAAFPTPGLKPLLLALAVPVLWVCLPACRPHITAPAAPATPPRPVCRVPACLQACRPWSARMRSGTAGSRSTRRTRPPPTCSSPGRPATSSPERRGRLPAGQTAGGAWQWQRRDQWLSQRPLLPPLDCSNVTRLLRLFAPAPHTLRQGGSAGAWQNGPPRCLEIDSWYLQALVRHPHAACCCRGGGACGLPNGGRPGHAGCSGASKGSGSSGDQLQVQLQGAACSAAAPAGRSGGHSSEPAFCTGAAGWSGGACRPRRCSGSGKRDKNAAETQRRQRQCIRR